MNQETEALRFNKWMLKIQNIHYASAERMDAASTEIIEER